MKKNSKFYVLVALCLIAILTIFFIVKGQELNIESEEVRNLYRYLGEADENHCGGLNVYKDAIVTKDDIRLEDKLCMAYFDVAEKESGELQITGTNKKNAKICKKGDITLTSDNGPCSYTKVSKYEINSKYKAIYGEDISEYKTFYIASTNACYLEGEDYICGSAETFNYSISAPTQIYRVLARATKKGNTIVLTDYFLKVSDNRCYTTTGNTENTECSKALEDKTVDVEFLKEYGTKYEHIFKKEKNTPYHWVKSSKK